MGLRARLLIVCMPLLALFSVASSGQTYVEQEDGSSSYIDCSDGTVVYDDEFALWIDAFLDAAQLDNALFFFTQCHSGGMLDDLASTLDGDTPTALLSASAWDESAWLCPTDAPAAELRACGIKTRGVSFYVDALVSILDRTPAVDLTMADLATALLTEDEAAPGGAATDPRFIPGAYWVDAPERPQSLFLGPGEAIRIGYSLRGDRLSSADRWALLFVGDADEQWTLNDLDLFYNVLLRLGYEEDNIIVLAGSQLERGASSDDPLLDPLTRSSDEAASGLPPYVDGYATRPVLVDTLTGLAGSVSPGAQFVFWTTGHGATTATLAWSDAPLLVPDVPAYGRLEAGDAILPDKTFADLYRFTGTAGETVEITLASGAFDAYVWLYDRDRQILASGDDELNATDCQIQVDLAYSGDYYVLVNSYGPMIDEYGNPEPNYVSETGPYTLALGAPRSSAEAEATPLPVSTAPVVGELEVGDAVDVLGTYYDSYTVDLWADEAYSASLASEAFDAFLSIHDASGTPLGSVDDMGPLATDARLWFLPIDGGAYELRVSSFEPGSTGEYTVGLQSGFSTMPLGGDPLTGGTVTGTLAAGDEVWIDEDVSGAYGDAYRFTLPAYQTAYIALRSDAFDSYLYVFDAYGTMIDSDDDSGGGGNALLELTSYVDTTYVIVATSYWAYETGDYSLTLSDEPIGWDVPDPVDSLAYGESVHGTLDSGDPTWEDGTPCDVLSFEGQAGTTVRIVMRSDAFDTYLHLYDGNGVSLAWDDDSGGGTDSLIVSFLPDDATYYIVANALSVYDAGAYQVTLESVAIAGTIGPGALPDPADATPLAESHAAVLEESDFLWEATSYCDVYAVSVAAGTELTVDMTSAVLDSLLILLDPTGVILARNDDANYTTYDARLVYTFAEPGTYYVIATTWDTYASGTYALTAVRKE